MFAEFFQGVPLTGFFSDREFGQNVLPETDPHVGKDGTRAARPPSRFPLTENAGNINNIVEFGTTTVFAVITVDNRITQSLSNLIIQEFLYFVISTLLQSILSVI